MDSAKVVKNKDPVPNKNMGAIPKNYNKPTVTAVTSSPFMREFGK